MSSSPRWWFRTVAELRRDLVAHQRSCEQCREAPNRPQRCLEGAELYRALHYKIEVQRSRWFKR